MSESEMVERAALKLARSRVYNGYDAETTARLVRDEMPRARADARAVIEAMQEPTKAMEEAGQVAVTDCPMGNVVWGAMIDAALERSVDTVGG